MLWHRSDKQGGQYPWVRWYHLINPIWWVQNDLEPDPPEWYTKGKLAWLLRNPFQNFGRFVIGFENRSHHYYETYPIDVNVLADVDMVGWKFGWLWGWHWLPLPYMSRTGKHTAWYIGWQKGGFAGVKFNILHSDIQVV